MEKDKFNEMEAQMIGKFPNTYSFTKSVAEEAVLKYGTSMPTCIFRPGMSKYDMKYIRNVLPI